MMDPDKWHIGWEWHSHTWYVDPPVGSEEDETVYFTERYEAFEYVDKQIREQPIQASLVDERTPMDRRYEKIEVEIPRPEVRPSHDPSVRVEIVDGQPKYLSAGAKDVDLPPHVAAYKDRVGL